MNDEYLKSADDIQNLIDSLRERSKTVSWIELPFLYKRIQILKETLRENI